MVHVHAIIFPNAFFCLLHVVVVILLSPSVGSFLIKYGIILTLKLFIYKAYRGFRQPNSKASNWKVISNNDVLSFYILVL